MMINRLHLIFFALISFLVTKATLANEIQPFPLGNYPVATTNMEIASEFINIGDDKMHKYLLGVAQTKDSTGYVVEILKHPKSAFISNISIPEQPQLYGASSGKTLPVLSYISFPTTPKMKKNEYTFPYFKGKFGVFEHMLEPDEKIEFADPKVKYPLVILTHGSSSHGIYSVKHAHSLASRGYIVAVIMYGDDRNAPGNTFDQIAFLRPFLTKSILDSILDSDVFGDRIDTDNIGISGHSLGGFTTLATSGGPFLGNPQTVYDKRITAGVMAAPWVGGNYNGNDFHAFAPNNSGLKNITIPMLSLFGTNDQATLSSFILPAMKQLSGPTYVIELIDQPHIFEDGSWKDKENWELWFFDAYLKGNKRSLDILAKAKSMNGGNQDRQLFEYQKLPN